MLRTFMHVMILVLSVAQHTKVPKWAGMMCSSIVKTNFSTPYSNMPLHTMVAFRFSEDGLTYDSRHVLPGQSREVYVQNRFNWKFFDYVVFDGYKMNVTSEDPHYIFGEAQSSLLQSSKGWRAFLGYQINGGRFNKDYSRFKVLNGADWLITPETKKIISAFAPFDYYSKYSKPQWIKDTYVIMVNGDVDEKETTGKYFRCSKEFVK